MAGIGPGDLHALAQSYLSACEEALDTIPTYVMTLEGAPDRILIAGGQPVADCCPQLSVHVGPLGEGSSSPPIPKASDARINRVTLVATIFRCIPVPDRNGNPPSVNSQQAAAEQINADKWALWNHVWNLVRAEQLFYRCGDVEWLGLNPLVPSGGCGGSTLTVRVALDGYEEVIGT